MKALIVGGSGRLGTALRRLLSEATAPSRADLDLADLVGIGDRVTAFKPDIVINCAAYTAVDAAEDDEQTAAVVNGQAVGELAAAAHRLHVPFVTYSTDYVFDGASDHIYTESSSPAPLNAYGRSKLAGEELALGYPGSLVIRTSWLLSTTHPSVVSTILTRAAAGGVDVVNDQWGRPTMVDDLAAATIGAVESEVTGILHLASPPTTTWFELAREACRYAGLDPALIRPTTSDALDRRALRPSHAVLGSERGFALPEWRPRLEAWLHRDPRVIETGGHPATRAGH